MYLPKESVLAALIISYLSFFVAAIHGFSILPSVRVSSLTKIHTSLGRGNDRRIIHHRHNGYPNAATVQLKQSSISSSNGEDEAIDLFENVLCELESEKLYGNTPRLCELDSLANWLRRGKLNIAPKYQRGYVWKQDRASRLIVTVL